LRRVEKEALLFEWVYPIRGIELAEEIFSVCSALA
jgi:hypothetical protein